MSSSRAEKPVPTYGYSEHYLGTAGAKYFRWRNGRSDVGGAISARLFYSHVAESGCVVDFGCGGGHLLKNIVCGRRIGVDINPEATRASSLERA